MSTSNVRAMVARREVPSWVVIGASRVKFGTVPRTLYEPIPDRNTLLTISFALHKLKVCQMRFQTPLRGFDGSQEAWTWPQESLPILHEGRLPAPRVR